MITECPTWLPLIRSHSFSKSSAPAALKLRHRLRFPVWALKSKRLRSPPYSFLLCRYVRFEKACDLPPYIFVNNDYYCKHAIYIISHISTWLVQINISTHWRVLSDASGWRFFGSSYFTITIRPIRRITRSKQGKVVHTLHFCACWGEPQSPEYHITLHVLGLINIVSSVIVLYTCICLYKIGN